MYILTIKEKGAYNDQLYRFKDFNDMVTFAEVALKNAETHIEVIIELAEKEGDQNDGN